MNVYSYGLNNPLTYTDPLGLEATLGGILGAGARGSASGGIRGGALPAIAGAAIEIYKACKDEPDDCARIEREIKQVADEILRRSNEMLKDPKGLYNTAYCTPNRSRGTTYLGHGDQIRSWQNKLRKLIAEADAKGCKVDMLSRLLLAIDPPKCPFFSE